MTGVEEAVWEHLADILDITTGSTMGWATEERRLAEIGASAALALAALRSADIDSSTVDSASEGPT